MTSWGMRAPLASLVFLAFLAAQSDAADIVGAARAIDGDTLEIAGRQFACTASTRPRSPSAAKGQVRHGPAAAQRTRPLRA